jgi:hypothetical protein
MNRLKLYITNLIKIYRIFKSREVLNYVNEVFFRRFRSSLKVVNI